MARFEPAKVHLEVFGREREFSLTVRVDRCSLVESLPTARALSEQIGDAAVLHARAQGQEITCKRGCNACCRQLIPISVVEARAIADRVAAMPTPQREAVRTRFAEAVRRMEGAGLLDPAAPRGSRTILGHPAAGQTPWDEASRRYFALGIPCPLLQDGECSVYTDRPMTCAEYNVITPREYCDSLDPRTQATERPVRMSEIVSDLARELLDAAPSTIPLALLCEWADAMGSAVDQRVSGETTFWRLMESVDAQSRTPFDRRGTS